MKNCFQRLSKVYFIVALFILIFAQGCTIKLVADYNANIAQEIISVSKQVDMFYGVLLETSDSERSYDDFKDRYIEIEVNIRGLVIQNKARPLNDESISISETTLNKWLKYKNKHQENWRRYQLPKDDSNKITAENIYKDTLINNHRKRFTRLFTAMSAAEVVKNTGDEQ